MWVAHWQARCAAELMAGAQQKSVLESRSLKRKRGLGLKSYVGPPSHVLLGVRISVFWPDDHAFYKVCRLHRQAVPLSATALDPFAVWGCCRYKAGPCLWSTVEGGLS